MHSPGFHYNESSAGFSAGVGFYTAQLPPPGYALAFDLTNPSLLVDGSGNRLTSGSAGTPVAEFYDIDGILRANQTTAGSRLPWDGTGISGNGTGWASLLSPITPGTEVTYVVIQKWSGSGIVVGAANSGTTIPYTGIVSGGVFYAGISSRFSSAAHSSTAWHCMSWRYNAPSSHPIRRDGVNLSTTHGSDPGGSTIDRLFALGAARNASGSCVQRVLIYLRVLSDAELAQAERWAVRGTGITLL